MGAANEGRRAEENNATSVYLIPYHPVLVYISCKGNGFLKPKCRCSCVAVAEEKSVSLSFWYTHPID